MTTENATLEVVQGGAGYGDVAARLLSSNFNVNALRTQATLRRDEWKHFDDAVVEVSRAQLVGVADVVAAGLTYSLPNALGKTILEWEKVSDMSPAQYSMSGVSEGQNDRIDFGNDNMPIPIVHKDFQLNIRALAASRERGESLDVTQVNYATRKVVEALEATLFKGATVLGASKPLYGYTTQPKRNTGSVTASWLTATGDQILTDVIAMINAAIADNMFGPYRLYVPLAVYMALMKDFKAGSDKSIMSRLLEIPQLSGIKATSQLTASNVVLVQMTRDVVEIIDGIQPTLVQWDSKGGFVQNFKVLAIMPPRFRNDYNDQSGIVHYA